MSRRLSFKSYQRKFQHPLRTGHGTWSVREGFILRLESCGKVGYGEVAPIPAFGTETVSAARSFLEALSAQPDLEVPGALSCCEFGLSAAGMAPAGQARDYKVAALLPAGRAALELAHRKAGRGYEVFKWKVGVEPIEVEQAILGELLQCLPARSQLRLDANGGLTLGELEQWLAALVPHRDRIEYLEQPLRVGAEVAMAERAGASGIPIALDESLNGRGGAHWLEAWSGPLVVKPALMGDCESLVSWLAPVAERVVLSSVFETQIGLENALALADRLPGLNRALGFDTMGAFADSLSAANSEPNIEVSERARFAPECIWKQLPHSI